MGKSAQRKGASGERELVELLNQSGYTAMRGGASFGTVPDVIGLPGIHIECKRVEHLNLSAAMNQSRQDAGRFGDGMPVVIHRRNRENWLVTMDFTDWMRIYQEAMGFDEKSE